MLLNMDTRQTKLFLSIDGSMDNAMLLKERLYVRRKIMTYMQSLWANHVEDVRSHQANEGLKSAEIEETKRSHLANEALTGKSLQETIRHQMAMDSETMRHNLASEAEISAHNRATEQIMRAENNIKAMSAQLNYAATHEKTITEKEIADIKNETEVMLTLAQQRINQMNAGSEKMKAEAALVSARGAADRGTAALEQAAIARDLSTSQKVKNYTSATHDIVSSVTDIGELVLDAKMLPGKVANTAADTLNKQAQAGKATAQTAEIEKGAKSKAKVSEFANTMLGEVAQIKKGSKSK